MQGDNQYAAEAIMAVEKLVLKIKPERSTPMKSAVVGLYTAENDGVMRYSNSIGLLTLDMDRGFKNYFLRLYDLQTLGLLFEVELYYGFAESYRPINHTFYIFDYPRGVIGFLFRNKDEGEIMLGKIRSVSPTLKQFETVRTHKAQQLRKQQQSQGFMGKVKKIFGGEEKQQQHQSEVYSVKKQGSIAFDMNTGVFNTQMISPEWQEMFDTLKLSNEDLKNKEVVNIIFEETIMNQIRKEAQSTNDKELTFKVKMVDQETRKYQDQHLTQMKFNKVNGLPPPPPPPPLLAPANPRLSGISKRENLMDEIRNNKLKLNHVQTKQNTVNLDISNLNRQERIDAMNNIAEKLRKRKQALNRRKASQDD